MFHFPPILASVPTTAVSSHPPLHIHIYIYLLPSNTPHPHHIRHDTTRRSLMSLLLAVVICRMCHGEGLTRDDFSRTQWKKPPSVRRCRKCLPTSRVAGLSSPPLHPPATTTTTTTSQRNEPPRHSNPPKVSSDRRSPPPIEREPSEDNNNKTTSQKGVVVSPDKSPLRGGGLLGPEFSPTLVRDGKRRCMTPINNEEESPPGTTSVSKKPRVWPSPPQRAAAAPWDSDDSNDDEDDDGDKLLGEVWKARMAKQEEQMNSLRQENKRLLAELQTTLHDHHHQRTRGEEEDSRGALEELLKRTQADVDRLTQVTKSLEDSLETSQQDVTRLTELNEILGKDRDYNKQELDKVRERKNYYREWARKSGETLQLIRLKIKERQSKA